MATFEAAGLIEVGEPGQACQPVLLPLGGSRYLAGLRDSTTGEVRIPWPCIGPLPVAFAAAEWMGKVEAGEVGRD